MDGRNPQELIKSHQGNIPLILSVPHGGMIKKHDILDRVNGILGIDKKTIELAEELIDNLQNTIHSPKKSYLTPSYVFSLLHRCKIDFNREEINAFNQSSQLAKQFYWFYHQKLKEFVLFNLENFNQSLLIDIHGFETEKRPNGYRDVDIVLGSNNLQSINPNLSAKKDWGRNIRGDIIKAFNIQEISIAPGHHLRKEYILTGGFITYTYGASNFKNSQSLQIEFSDRVRLYNVSLRKKVIETLTLTLYDSYLSKFL